MRVGVCACVRARRREEEWDRDRERKGGERERKRENLKVPRVSLCAEIRRQNGVKTVCRACTTRRFDLFPLPLLLPFLGSITVLPLQLAAPKRRDCCAMCAAEVRQEVLFLPLPLAGRGRLAT